MSSQLCIDCDYRLDQNMCGLAPGDLVKVLSEASSTKYFWSWDWAPEGRDLIGKLFRVIRLDDNGILLRNSSSMKFHTLPFFLLKKLEETCPFKPFDKVLMRIDRCGVWYPTLFGRFESKSNYPYKPMFIMQEEGAYGRYCSGAIKCIPYEGNEHLAYTKNNPECKTDTDSENGMQCMACQGNDMDTAEAR